MLVKIGVSLLIAFVIATIAIAWLVSSVFAIDNPDSTPTIEDLDIYRNALETGDMFIIIKENTPYATPPSDYTYTQAFIWRLYDTDGTTELAQSMAYSYNENGYGYNVVGFYFDADDAPTWNQLYYLKLTGTPVAFDNPPTYTFNVELSDYSELTATAEVLDAISVRVLDIATDLNTDWGLNSDDYLTTSAELGTVLSLAGESFFRSAIYGIQALAPSAFDVNITDITSTDRSWDTEFSSNITDQYSSTYIGDAMDAGNTELGTDYNLFGLLLTLGICGGLIGCCVYVGGDIWGSAILAIAVAVICTRMAMVGMGEMGLVAAVSWIIVSGKTWKVF